MNPELDREKLIALRNGSLKVEKANEYWSDEDITKLMKMFDEGFGISNIALELKRTEISVTCSLQNLGLFASQCKHRSRSEKEDAPCCLCSQCQVEDCPSRDNEKKTCPKNRKKSMPHFRRKQREWI